MVYILFDVFRLGAKEICLLNVPNNSFHCPKLLNRSSFLSICTEIANISSIEKNPYKLNDQYSTIINWEFFQYLSKELHNSSFPGVDTYIQYVEAQSRLKPPNNIKLRLDFDNLVKSDILDVKKFVYPLEILPCIHTNPTSTSLFVAIISAPNNFENRNIIRQTWLNNLRKQSHLDFFTLTGFGFIIGLSTNQEIQTRIKAESKMHGDILQISMLDLYYDLTIKVVKLLNWIDSHCSLVDDDVYVNTKNLLTVLKSLNPSELSLYGSAGESIPIRDPGKNYISFENWPWTWYPPFILGGAILIPGRAIKPLKAASQTIPYFPFEDVFYWLKNNLRRKTGPMSCLYFRYLANKFS
uniref:Hexosyltransferase n=1 Tax=Daphnia galeata TaxID=27404 RepID=A0A8J2WD61_9CRUS|nr:unnamed protein product [Daphnia galeata]